MRVATRRLQTLLSVTALKRNDESVAKLRRQLKRLRRLLGEKRDIDLVVARLRARIRRTSSKQRRRVWLTALRFMTGKGVKATRSVRRKLKQINEARLERKFERAIREQLDKTPPWSALRED